MKEAIASVEIYLHQEAEPVRRLTLVISAPRRAEAFLSETGGDADTEIAHAEALADLAAGADADSTPGSKARPVDPQGWECRVALADAHVATVVRAPDSVGALAAAIDRGRKWLVELEATGARLCRDRAGEISYRY